MILQTVFTIFILESVVGVKSTMKVDNGFEATYPRSEGNAHRSYRSIPDTIEIKYIDGHTPIEEDPSVGASENSDVNMNIDYLKLLPSLHTQIASEIQNLNSIISNGYVNSTVARRREMIINLIDQLKDEYNIVLTSHLQKVHREVDFLKDYIKKLKFENDNLIKVAKEITEKNQQLFQITKIAPEFFSKFNDIKEMVQALKKP